MSSGSTSQVSSQPVAGLSEETWQHLVSDGRGSGGGGGGWLGVQSQEKKSCSFVHDSHSFLGRESDESIPYDLTAT